MSKNWGGGLFFAWLEFVLTKNRNFALEKILKKFFLSENFDENYYC